MDVNNQPTRFNTFEISSYSLSVLFAIMIIILSYIDKKKFDAFIIINLIFSVTQIIILSVTLFLEDLEKHFGLLPANIILLMANIITPFLTYVNSIKDDFMYVCTFMAITKIFSGIAFIVYSFTLKLIGDKTNKTNKTYKTNK